MNTKSLVKRFSDKSKIVEKLKPFIGGVKIDPYEDPIPFIVKDNHSICHFVSKPAYSTFSNRDGFLIGIAYGMYTEIINELIRRDSDLFKLEELKLDYLLKFNNFSATSVTTTCRTYTIIKNNFIEYKTKGNPSLAKKYNYVIVDELGEQNSMFGPIMKIPVMTLNPNYILDTDLSYYSNLVTSLVPKRTLLGDEEAVRKVWDYCRDEALYTIIKSVCVRDTKLLDLCLSNVDEVARLLAEKLCVGRLEPTKRVLVWQGTEKSIGHDVYNKNLLIARAISNYRKRAYSILKELENMPIEDPSNLP